MRSGLSEHCFFFREVGGRCYQQRAPREKRPFLLPKVSKDL